MTSSRRSRRDRPSSALRRATAALLEVADADADREWSEQEAVEVAEAVVEHLLVVAAALPSNVPGWLTGWQQLARRYGVIATPVPGATTGGVDSLIDLRVCLEQAAYRTQQSAAGDPGQAANGDHG